MFCFESLKVVYTAAHCTEYHCTQIASATCHLSTRLSSVDVLSFSLLFLPESHQPPNEPRRTKALIYLPSMTTITLGNCFLTAVILPFHFITGRICSSDELGLANRNFQYFLFFSNWLSSIQLISFWCDCDSCLKHTLYCLRSSAILLIISFKLYCYFNSCHYFWKEQFISAPKQTVCTLALVVDSKSVV